MADISDIETAMVSIIASSLCLGDGYLAGSTVVSSLVGAPCRVYRGWPIANVLDADLANGIATVSVFPAAGSTRHCPGHLLQWKQNPSVPPTLTVSVSGNVVTFGGAGGSNQVAGISFGSTISPAAYAYRLTASDTPDSVAEELASQIPNATFSGSSVTVPSSLNLQAVVAADQPEFLETRRQEQQITVIGWCPTPAIRDAVMSAVDAGFANMQDQWGRQTQQFGLPDGSDGFLRYVSSMTDDRAQKAKLWRRDLRYRVEYPTTLIELHPIALFVGGHVYQQDVEIEVTFGSVIASPSQCDQTLSATASVDLQAALAASQPNQTIAATTNI